MAHVLIPQAKVGTWNLHNTSALSASFRLGATVQWAAPFEMIFHDVRVVLSHQGTDFVSLVPWSGDVVLSNATQHQPILLSLLGDVERGPALCTDSIAWRDPQRPYFTRASTSDVPLEHRANCGVSAFVRAMITQDATPAVLRVEWIDDATSRPQLLTIDLHFWACCCVGCCPLSVALLGSSAAPGACVDYTITSLRRLHHNPCPLPPPFLVVAGRVRAAALVESVQHHFWCGSRPHYCDPVGADRLSHRRRWYTVLAWGDPNRVRAQLWLRLHS